MEKKKASLQPDEFVVNKIHLLRGKKVMMDNDLADLYNIETKRLKESVKRNIDRFPEDFMFELSRQELESLRSQFATSNKGRGGSRYLPMAFTEQGVAMLSSVLNSETAIRVNIQIIRVFTKMRELLLSQNEMFAQLQKMERKLTVHDADIAVIFETFKKLLSQNSKQREPIGFKTANKSASPAPPL